MLTDRLLPWGTAEKLWVPLLKPVVRRPVYVDPARMVQEHDHYSEGVPAEWGGPFNNCLSSSVMYTSPSPLGAAASSLHLPILDVDGERTDELDAEFRSIFGSHVQWVESTNNWHVYIGVGPYAPAIQAMPWSKLSTVLSYMAEANLIDSGWAWYSLAEAQCVVRKPGYRKPITKPKWTTPWSCMWCSKGFDTEQAMEDHEEVCSG